MTPSRLPKAAAPTPPPDDLDRLNGDPIRDAGWWSALVADDWGALEVRVRQTIRARDDFVTIPFPRLASTSDRQIAGAVEQYRREAAVVDARLSRDVAVQQKAVALSDLCDRLRDQTGVQLSAGQSVADEKVSLFCRPTPLREVMRQLSRPFGYTWTRGGKAGAYRYELVQDLRSQLLEEELRNRDRNEALLALDREIQRYRPYLNLTPDEALARSKTAPPEEKRLLETLSGAGWGPIQMYHRFSAQDLAALRAGQWLRYAAEPGAGDRRLPSELARSVLQPFRDWSCTRGPEGWRISFDATQSGRTPVPAIPEARGSVGVGISQSELGRMALRGHTQWVTLAEGGRVTDGGGTGSAYVEGVSPTVTRPDNRRANAAFATVSELRRSISVRPRPSCMLPPDPNRTEAVPPEPRVTVADVIEALHQATGLPIVADQYTRLFKPEAVSVRNLPLFDALNQLADTMRMRWRWERGWLQLRSTSYYDDRLKEVPNRLLARWAASRRQHGALTLDDLGEIAGLSDAQLDGTEMAEGARACSGLVEWNLARNSNLRRHLRFLAMFPPEQRQAALGPTGLLFTRMPLAQQQRFIALALENSDTPFQSMDELEGAALRVEYTQPGGFQWGEPGHPGQGFYTRWVVPLGPEKQAPRVLRPLVRERTREAVLQEVRRIDPRLRHSLAEALRHADPRLAAAPQIAEEEQIFPTRLDLTFVYVPGASSGREIHIQSAYASYNPGPARE